MTLNGINIFADYIPHQRHTPLQETVIYEGRSYRVYETNGLRPREEFGHFSSPSICPRQKIKAIFINPSYSKEALIQSVKEGKNINLIIEQIEQKDWDVLLELALTEKIYFGSLPKAFWEDKNAVLAAVSRDAKALQYICPEFKKDKALALAAIETSAYALKYVSSTLRTNKEVVLAAVCKDGNTLEYADLSLKQDKEVVLTAITHNPQALRFAQLNDKDTVLWLLSRLSPLIFEESTNQFLSHINSALFQNKDFVLAAVCLNGLILNYAAKELQQDREVALAALCQTYKVWTHLCPKFQEDEDFALAAVHQKAYLFLGLPRQLKSSVQIVKAAHHSLFNELNSLVENPSKRESLLIFTHDLLDDFENYQLHEEHPLIQRALEVYTIAVGSDNVRNPYVLYRKLQTTIRQEALFAEFAGLRNRVMLQRHFTFADIPTDVISFEDLFNAIEKRGARQEDIASFCDGATLQELKHNMLGFGKLIPCLLAQKGQPQDPLPLTTMYLYLILKEISQEDDTREGNELSNREIRFLKFASMVKECQTGQADAIEQYYIYTINHQGISQNQFKIEAVVDHAIQVALQKVLVSETFLKEMIGLEKIDQQAHQTLYLKNRYHKQIGLHHTLKFDQHAHVIYDSLLGKETKVVLDAIKRHLHLEQGVLLALEKAIKTSAISYLEFVHYFEIKLGLKGNYEEFFTFDAHFNPIGVTHLAVHKIFNALGIGDFKSFT
jgi:hypothetical protein